MRRKFKNPNLQKIYDWFRKNQPGPETKGQGAAHNAYYVGRHVNQTRQFSVRGSPAYAGWAAGVDDAKRGGKDIIHEGTALYPITPSIATTGRLSLIQSATVRLIRTHRSPPAPPSMKSATISPVMFRCRCSRAN